MASWQRGSSAHAHAEIDAENRKAAALFAHAEAITRLAEALTKLAESRVEAQSGT